MKRSTILFSIALVTITTALLISIFYFTNPASQLAHADQTHHDSIQPEKSTQAPNDNAEKSKLATAAEEAPQESKPEPEPKPSPGVRCIIYDRPPRTGSTTVGNALKSCLQSRRWSVAGDIARPLRDRAITSAFAGMKNDYAVVWGHIWMNGRDLETIRRRCDTAFFMTSATRMDDRLWSAAKIMSTTAKNGNLTIGSSERALAFQWLEDFGPGYVPYLDAYPFINVTGPQLMGSHGDVTEVPAQWQEARVEEGFRYDFVFRRQSLREDVLAVLTAMGCKPSFAVYNVHSDREVGEEEDVQKSRIMKRLVSDGVGSLYPKLMENSLQNDAGLQRLARLMDFNRSEG